MEKLKLFIMLLLLTLSSKAHKTLITGFEIILILLDL